MVLLAVNVAFTGYVVYRLNGTTQEQIDSVSQTTETTQTTPTTTPTTTQEAQSTTVDEVTPPEE